MKNDISLKKFFVIAGVVTVCIILVMVSYFYFSQSGVFSSDDNSSNNEIVDNSNNDVDNDNSNNNGDEDNNSIDNNNDVNSGAGSDFSQADPVGYFENINKSENKNVIKDGFVKIVDFIFYGTSINGYTFSELTDSAKLKIMSIALSIDSKIEEYFPGYKESISTGAKKIYSNVKAFVVELYLDTTLKVCGDNTSLCKTAKDDFLSMKESFGVTWDFIKDISGAGLEKIKEWYEMFRE